jgi:hypothetical protein
LQPVAVLVAPDPQKKSNSRANNTGPWPVGPKGTVVGQGAGSLLSVSGLLQVDLLLDEIEHAVLAHGLQVVVCPEGPVSMKKAQAKCHGPSEISF